MIAALVLGLGSALVPVPAGAISVFGQCGGNSASDICKATKTDNATTMIKNVVNTLLVVIGIIAVIMIVIGGIRYTLSGGDAASTKSARDTILYAVVGLVIAMMAYAIVNFVVSRFN